MKASKRIKNWIIILPFCLCILVPTLDNIFEILPKVNLKENRTLAEKPIFDITNLDQYPRAYNSYFNDQFSMRGIFTKIHRRLSVIVFNVSSIWNVVMGTDNWLFMGTENYLELYERKNLFSTAELDNIGNEFQYRKQFVEENGGKIVVVFAPTKNQIYPEKLPSYINKRDQINKTEQLSEYLKGQVGIDVIDLHQPFMKTKKTNTELLYFKGDTHWSHFGAFTGAKEIRNYLHQYYPELPEVKQSNYDTTSVVKVGGNLASSIDLREEFAVPVLSYKYQDSSWFKEAIPKLYPIPEGFAYKDGYERITETINPALPSALCITDSYGGFIQPFLSPLFSRSVFIFDKWEFKLNEEIVENEKADVVFFLLMEGHITNLLKNHSHDSFDSNKE